MAERKGWRDCGEETWKEERGHSLGGRGSSEAVFSLNHELTGQQSYFCRSRELSDDDSSALRREGRTFSKRPIQSFEGHRGCFVRDPVGTRKTEVEETASRLSNINSQWH